MNHRRMDLNHLMSTSYPRDLVGYGRNAPHPHWPYGGPLDRSLVAEQGRRWRRRRKRRRRRRWECRHLPHFRDSR
ncbi:hypothetical protein BOSE29B_80123 [Bosea sp. 29B]|nr:hypothetical protein BOSE29B_80123 [Bosea sp. 29B]